MSNENRDIGQIADALTAQLRQVETLFRKRYVGSMPSNADRSVEFDSGSELDDEDGDVSSWHGFLCFGKRMEKWQLFYVYGDSDTGPGDMKPEDLYSATLEVRHKAVLAIPKLGELLEKQRVEYLRKLQDASSSLGEYIATLERGVN